MCVCVCSLVEDSEIRWGNKSRRRRKSVCICVYKMYLCVCVFWWKTPRSDGETNRGGGDTVCIFACAYMLCMYMRVYCVYVCGCTYTCMYI